MSIPAKRVGILFNPSALIVILEGYVVPKLPLTRTQVGDFEINHPLFVVDELNLLKEFAPLILLHPAQGDLISGVGDFRQGLRI